MICSKFLKLKLALLISAAVIVISAANILSYIFLPGGLTEKKVIIIEPNFSVHKISLLLEQEKVIKYRPLFEIITV